MKYFGAALLFSVLLFASCKQKEEHYIVESFPVAKTLTGEALPSFDTLIGLFGIVYAGDYVVCDQMNQDWFFSIFDKDYNPLGELCRRGNGPGEFLSPAYFGQCDADGGVWILDRAKSDFVKINLPESLSHPVPVIEKRYDMSRCEGLSVRNLFYIDDNLLFGTSDDEFCRTFTVDPTGNEIHFNEHALEFPPTSFPWHDLTQSMATLKPDGTRIASAFFNFPQIDIYSSAGERVKTIFYGRVLAPGVVNPTGAMDYYGPICSTDKYIYALYREYNGIYGYSDVVHVYDWDGLPVASLVVGSLTDFYVTRDDKRLVTIDYNKEADVAVTYDISL